MWRYQAGWSRRQEERRETETEEKGRNSLGVRPGHIGFSGESWSMFPGSWLTRGIGYKATRPPDWFILSATPAHAALSRNYSVCLPLSDPAAPLSLCPPPLFFPISLLLVAASLSFSLAHVHTGLSFSHRVLTHVSCPTRSYRVAFDLRRKKDRLDTTLRSLTAGDSASFRRPDVEACDVRTCGKDERFQQRRTFSRIALIVERHANIMRNC